MEKLASQAVVRKRNSDKIVRNAFVGIILALVFSMFFCVYVLRAAQTKSTIAVMDNAGNVLKGRVVPFKEAREYHKHLQSLAIAGIYTRDEAGAMNNNLDAVASPEVIRKADKRWTADMPSFKEKRIVQFPRVKGYIVDVISDQEMHLKVSLQLIRQAFALDGDEFPGVKDINVILYFQRNESLESNYYKPWELVDFKEMVPGNAPEEIPDTSAPAPVGPIPALEK